MISKETEAEIIRLYHGEKWPIGTIASQLGLHHTTVQRVLRHTGVDPKVVAPRPSLADPFVPFILEQLEKYPGLRASRLFVMIKERGYPGGPDLADLNRQAAEWSATAAVDRPWVEDRAHTVRQAFEDGSDALSSIELGRSRTS